MNAQTGRNDNAMQQTLSVAIITKNEEANLPRTLASVRFAEQIVVLDSGSTDRTVEIARAANATVYQEPWRGFAAAKNSAIARCTGAWVLSLDADEELTPELQTEIQSLLSSNPPVDAYFIRRRNLFLGRWIRHGGFYPDPKLRLFRRASASVITPPRFQDRPVHETIAFDGKAATLDHDLIHHAYPTLENYIEHMDRYSTLGSELLVASGKVSRAWPAFVWNVSLVPEFTFLWNYVFRLGFLDGREGLLLHLYQAAYTSWKYAKAWQSARTKTD
ncbi:MAG: glycosyltransferase family 2 protein [Acidobacteriaceae bacterium]